MIYKEAEIKDIHQMHLVRISVKENVLSNPDLITLQDYEDYLTIKGKGFVYEINNIIAGFSIVDLADKKVWALFIDPAYEGKGIGKKLHDLMLNWYFNQTTKTIWLGTEPKTRAESFYRKNGWKEKGMHGKNEIKFEMSFEDWKLNQLHKAITHI
jgi:GNAT superfamily N-acetyltransferase